MSTMAIESRGISKQYRIGSREPYMALRDVVGQWARAPLARIRRGLRARRDDTFWALDDVSFSVAEGEVVGVMGRNGAGKTTLLKVLSRITYPTRGSMIFRGRVASLLEVGTGFHPELTGRENIYFNGAILGMQKQEIKRKLNAIVAFAEVERFIDTPVKRYSTGMQLRLAFAVAAHLEPEILLVDEVLAVGDLQFQKKCIGKMNDVARTGRTIIFVSHNMEAIERLCSRGIVLHAGRVIANAPIQDAIRQYLRESFREHGERTWDVQKDAPGDQVARITAVRVVDVRGNPRVDFDVRDPVCVELEYHVLQDGHGITAAAELVNERNQTLVYSFDNLDSPWTGAKRPAGRYRSICRIPGDFLNEGHVIVNVAVITHPFPLHARVEDALRFRVCDAMDPRGVRGNMPREWPQAALRPRLPWTVERF
jgi:lipopolysaccharide transport system ATP-binding protein